MSRRCVDNALNPDPERRHTRDLHHGPCRGGAGPGSSGLQQGRTLCRGVGEARRCVQRVLLVHRPSTPSTSPLSQTLTCAPCEGRHFVPLGSGATSTCSW
jgi:hypothetical protein